jgi:VCBS repeat-containing protein
VLNGGGGNNYLNYTSSSAGVTVDITANTASGGHADGDVISNFAYLTGSGYDDMLTGGSWIYGGSGNDTLVSAAGGTSLEGQTGADILDGSASANASAVYNGSTAGVTIDLAAGTGIGGHAQGDTLISIENATGSYHSDVIYGQGGANSIYGIDGHDYIDGRAGNDSLYGQVGNDILRGGLGNDTLDGGADSDIILFTGLRSAYTITWDSGNSRYNVVGIDGSDTVKDAEYLVFDDEVLTLDNVGSFSTTTAGSYVGGKLVIGSATGEYVTAPTGEPAGIYVALAGSDTILGTSGFDIVFGGDGSNTLYGYGGSDILYGGAGGDSINGGTEDDFLYGDNSASFDVAAALAADPTLQYNSATGKLYKMSASTANYTSAESAAAATSVQGVAGRLVRIESFQENQFVNDLVGGNYVWIGGSDSVTEGTWLAPNGSPHAYFNWNNGEPNGSTSENYTALYGYIAGGIWNDDAGAGSCHYVIEYDPRSLVGGDDTFAGETGNDTIDGGGGTDTVVVTGNRADYSIVQSTIDNTFTLTDSVNGRDGIDVLRNVEKIRFADGTITLSYGQTVENFSSSTTAVEHSWELYGATTSGGSNYGYQSGSVTNGADNGEAGGTLARSDTWSYYADNDIGGSFSLNDSIQSHGHFTFQSRNNWTAGLQLGHFGATEAQSNAAPPFVGITLAEPTDGTNYRAFARVTLSNGTTVDGTALLIGGNSNYSFTSVWDPSGNGSLTVNVYNNTGSLVGTSTASLDSTQRTTGATVDAYGLLNINVGGANSSDTVNFFIDDVSYSTRGEMNVVPSDITLSANTVSEGSVNGTVVGTATGFDSDPGTVFNYSVVDFVGSSRFAINPTTGVITVSDTALIDYEASATQTVVVRATDQFGVYLDKTLTINVTNTNEAPVIVPASSSNLAMSFDNNGTMLQSTSGASVVTTAGTVTAYTDGTRGGAVQLSTDANFVFDVEDRPVLNGEWTLSSRFKDLRFETGTWNTLFRGVTDHQLLLTPGSHILGYYDNDTATGFISTGYDATSLDDGLWHTATVVRTTNGTITYYIDGVSVGSVTDTTTGTYLNWYGTVGSTQPFAQYLDDFRYYSTALNATQVAAIHSDSEAIITLSETATTGTVVETITSLNDAGDTVTYSLDDSASNRFAIHSSTGEITVANAALLDWDTTQSHTITVRATDQLSNFSTSVLTISLTAGNEAPVTLDTTELSRFSDDFNDGNLDGWTPISLGNATYNWTASNGGAQEGSDSGHGFLSTTVSGQESAITYRLSANVYAPSDYAYNDGVGFVFGFQDASNYWMARWFQPSWNASGSSTYKDLQIVRVSSGVATVLGTADNVSLPLNSLFEIVSNGTNLKLIVNGTTHVSVNTTSPALGTFGLYTHDSDSGIRYDNVRLETGFLTVAENDSNGTTIGTVTAQDPDVDATFSYSLTDSAGGRFAIHSSTGVITIANGALLDYESAASHTVAVRTTDQGGLTYDRAVVISLTNAADSPRAIAASGGTNLVTNGSFETQTAGQGPNVAPDGWTVSNTAGAYVDSSRSSNGSGLVPFHGWGSTLGGILSQTINTTVGETYVLAFDMGEHGNVTTWNTSNLLVEAISGGTTVLSSVATDSTSVGAGATGTGHRTFTYTFTATAATTLLRFTDQSLISSLDSDLDFDNVRVWSSVLTIAENSANGTSVGTAVGIDDDGILGLTYTLTDTAGGRFAINSSTGSITVANSSLLDYETNTSHTIVVRATDAGGLTFDRTLTIGVTNVNEAPVVSGIDDHPLGFDDRSIEFQGGDDTVDLTGLPVNTTAGAQTTVEFWMYWDGGNSQMPFGFQHYDLYFISDKFGFNTANSDLYGIANATSTLANGWHHIAAVFTHGQVSQNKLYIDGVEQTLTQQVGTTTTASVTSNARISSWAYDNNYMFDGKIDELRIWDGARTVDQVNDLMYDRINGSQTNLMAAYSFENMATGANGVVDRSENGRHGTIGGMTSGFESTATPARQSSILETDMIQLDVDATDVDSANLTYTWTQTSGPTVAFEKANDVIGTVLSMDFEHNTSGIVSYNGAPHQVSDAYASPSGRNALLVETMPTGSTNNFGGVYFTNNTAELVAGSNVRISYWARTVDAPMDVYFSNQSGGGDVSNLSHMQSLTTSWQKFERLVTLDVTKNILYVWGALPSKQFLLDDLRIERLDQSSITFTAPNVASNTNVAFDVAISDGTNTVNQTVSYTIIGNNDVPIDLVDQRSDDQGVSINAGAANNQYFQVTDGGGLLGGLTDFTIRGTVSSAQTGVSTWLSYAVPGDANHLTLVADGTIYVQLNGAAWNTGVSTALVYDSQPHEWTVSRIGATGAVAFYVDGVLKASTLGFQSGVSLSPGGELILAQEQDSVGGGFDAGQMFSGTYHDIAIYNTAWDTPTVAANSGRVPTANANMVAHWSFDSMASGQVNDLVGTRHLTLQTITPSGGWVSGNATTAGNAWGLSVAENSANGTSVAKITGLDFEPGSTLTYSLTDNASGRFAIDNSTGVVTVANSSLLNYEANTSHSISVRVTDQGGLTYDENYTINVTNVNEGPVSVGDSATAIEAGWLDNTATGKIVDPFATSGSPSPLSLGALEFSSTRTNSLPNGSMANVSPYWLQQDKTNGTSGRAIVLGVSGLQSGATYRVTSYVFTDDANLSALSWGTHNVANSTVSNAIAYNLSELGTIQRVTTDFVSVNGSQTMVLESGSTDPIGSRFYITGIELQLLSPGTTPTGNVLTNDSDVDAGDTKTVTGVAAGVQSSSAGSVATSVNGLYGSINIAANGAYTYTVDNSNATVQALRTSVDTITDVFTYTMQDAGGLTNTTQITVTIQGANDAPTAVADTITATEAGGTGNGTAGTNPTGSVLTNDVEPDHGNQLIWTNEFQNWGLTAGFGSSVGLTQNGAAAPDGSMTADLLDYAAATNPTDQDVYQVVAGNPAGRTVTFSVWLKGNVGETIAMRLDQAGVSGTYELHTLNGDWQRLSITRTYPADGSTLPIYARFGTRPMGTPQGTATQVYAWGAQLEYGSSATDYRPVGAAPASPFESNTVVGVGAGIQGSTAGSVGTSVSGTYGSINLAANGTYNYTVDNNNAAVHALRNTANTLADVFTYTITDLAGATSTSQVTVTIQGANDAPTDVVATRYLSTLTPTATNNINSGLTNDSFYFTPTMTLGGVDYARGLGMHAPSSGVGTADYSINGASVFKTTIGLSDGSPGGSVIFRVYVDGVIQYTSPTVTSSTSPIDLAINTTGGTTLRLEVDNAGSYVNDGSGWFNARFEGGSVGLEVAENVADGTVVGSVNRIDADWGDNATYSLVDNASGRFAINNTTGQITVANGSLLNFEAATSHSVIVRATDVGGLTYDKTLTINLTDVNEAPNAIDISQASQSADMALTLDNIYTVYVNGVLVGTDSSWPTVEQYTVNLQPGDVIAVYGQDVGGAAAFVSDITLANGARFGTGADWKVATSLQSNWNTQGFDDSGWTAATEYGTAPNTVLGPSLTNTNILTSRAQWIWSSDRDAHDDVYFRYVVSDKMLVAENASNGTVLGTAVASDADAGSSISYSLQDSAGGRFAIHSSTGSITVANGSLLDYESSTSHEITVRATDQGGLTFDRTLTIGVTWVNEAPVAVADGATAVEASGVANATAGTTPTGNVLTNDTDVDAIDTQTVSGVLAGVQASAAANVGSAVAGTFGSINIAANGAYTYTVDNSNATVQALRTSVDTITDVFTYTMQDAAGLTKYHADYSHDPRCE